VHKFGGTSLADAARIRHVADVVQQQAAPRAVVVSAMSSVTNRLLGLVAEATTLSGDIETPLADLTAHHVETARALVPAARAEALADRFRRDADTIAATLRAVRLMRSAPDAARDLVAGYGEAWSTLLLTDALADAGADVAWLDARNVLVVRHGSLGPEVRWDATRERFGLWHKRNPADTLVITGFVAATEANVPTTLGRNGSDFSAAIFARLLGADALHIWTDVDGVMTADPSVVSDAQRLGELSYEEAMEMAYFGAKVLHPRTLTPALRDGIPLFIRNTFDAAQPGTRIHAGSHSDEAVKGFATVHDLALVNVEGAGMIGVPGIARRLFSALEEEGVSVILISQASSEYSICFAVPEIQASVARQAAERAFADELERGQIHAVTVTGDCSILAVVGDRMSGTPGVASTFFGALGTAGVNVRAIAQGASERNISAVVARPDAARALRAAHAGFYLSPRTLSVGLIGPGHVGAALLDQMADRLGQLRAGMNVDLRVRGVINTERMLVADRALDLATWRDDLDASGLPANLDFFADHVQTDYHPHAVLIDCTASDRVARRYGAWLDRGIHIVTPNKRANTGPLRAYRHLRDATRGIGPSYFYETTVGAGLPIIQTLQELIETGDEVASVRGILSGTLSYLFNAFDGSRPFSAILREAKAQGFTEPDPRDDLSGMDVARKVVILGREMGLDLELDDVEVESLVPEDLRGNGAPAAFLDALEAHDEAMTQLLKEAQAQDAVLRFVGSVDAAGQAAVRLERVPADHPFARIQLTDNIVEFRTARYDPNPLIVQGPGAGPDVTAAGVFADLLRIAT
jgi:aspartokinase/homoserine dehydrogenase 1